MNLPQGPVVLPWFQERRSGVPGNPLGLLVLHAITTQYVYSATWRWAVTHLMTEETASEGRRARGQLEVELGRASWSPLLSRKGRPSECRGRARPPSEWPLGGRGQRLLGQGPGSRVSEQD